MVKTARDTTPMTSKESLHFKYYADQRLDAGGIPGWLVREYKKCGKANCRCARGQFHGPYFYHVVRDRYGRKHRQYVRQAEVARVRGLCLDERAKRLTRPSVRETIRTLKRLWEDLDDYLDKEGWS